MEKKLERMQKEVNRLYERDGLSEEVLFLQLRINKYRHEQDIPDENEFIYDEYAQ